MYADRGCGTYISCRLRRGCKAETRESHPKVDLLVKFLIIWSIGARGYQVSLDQRRPMIWIRILREVTGSFAY